VDALSDFPKRGEHGIDAADAQSSRPADRNKLLVKLDVFDGPLDLLLQLVLEQDLDISTVSLAAVCEQYLVYLALMDALDIEIASEYLVIAATLLFIKSKRLLPPPPAPFDADMADEASIAEEALRQRLRAYQHFKNAGRDLRARLDDNAAYYARGRAGEEGLVQRYRLDVQTIAAAFARALENAAARPAILKRETFSMVVKMNYVLRQVRAKTSLMLSELVAGCEKLEIVVTFLAVLELIRARKIVFDQVGRFEDIVLMPAPKGAVDQLAQSA